MSLTRDADRWGDRIVSTTAPAKKKSLQDRLRDGVVLCGEGYVFELERRGYVKSGPYVPEVVIDFPVAVQELHREFVRAGSDVVLALTYYAHRDKMKVVNREREVEALNRQAVKLAKEVADETGALLAGNICNTWVYDPKDAKRSSLRAFTYAGCTRSRCVGPSKGALSSSSRKRSTGSPKRASHSRSFRAPDSQRWSTWPRFSPAWPTGTTLPPPARHWQTAVRWWSGSTVDADRKRCCPSCGK